MLPESYSYAFRFMQLCFLSYAAMWQTLCNIAAYFVQQCCLSCAGLLPKLCNNAAQLVPGCCTNSGTTLLAVNKMLFNDFS